MSESEYKQALQTTEEWIRYMEQRIVVLSARKQVWARKTDKLKQDRHEYQKSLVDHQLSDWNSWCLSEMARQARMGKQ